MTKPISPRLHSLLDYGLTLGNLTVPSLLGTSTKARLVFAGFGAVQGVLNALTVQPYAVRKLVPFALHGTIERDSLPVLAVVPLLAGLWDEKKARYYWLGATAALVTVYLLTDWDAKRTDK